MKRIISLILSFVLIIPSISVFANEKTIIDNNSIIRISDNATVRIIDNNSLLFEENAQDTLVSITQNNYQTRTELKNLDTGKIDYFLRDEIEGTIYSSITGNTLKIENFNNDLFNTYSSSDHKEQFLRTARMSFRDIAYLAGQNATISGMATAILAYYGIAAGISLIVTVLSGIGALVASDFERRYPNGGIAIDIYKTWIYHVDPYGDAYWYENRDYRNTRIYS